METQSRGEKETKDKREILLQYLFWMGLAVAVGYIAIFVL